MILKELAHIQLGVKSELNRVDTLNTLFMRIIRMIGKARTSPAHTAWLDPALVKV